MPRTTVLTTGLGIGGAETQLVMLSKALKQRGWQVDVVSMLPAGALADELTREAIPVSDLAMKRGWPDPRAVWRLATHLKKVRPHILHCHMVHANLLGRAVRPLVRVPVLVNTAHSIREGGFWRELAYRLSDPLCDLVTQVSLAGTRRYIDCRISGREKTIWLPNAADLKSYRADPELRAEVRREMAWGDEFTWIAVGNLRAPKDYPNLLDAFSALRRTEPSARLAIAGSGELEQQLKQKTADLGIESAVQWLGLRPDVARLLAAADGYVISSEREGTPMALLEAAAAALPIVATDVGGNRDVVSSRECGLLVPARDAGRLREAMQQVMHLPAKARHQMGQAARRQVEKQFGLSGIVAKWDNIYRQLLSARAMESRSHGRRQPLLKSGTEAG